VAQFFFALFSTFLAWVLFLAQVGIAVYLGWVVLLVAFYRYNAYISADTLNRFEVPIAGKLASEWVDSE
ncbi:hypothetical protein HDU76_009600, partial [Blyttiomyces sp. JEL0837]